MTAGRMGDHIGRVLDNRYRLVSSIGAGASGQVFLADDIRLRRRVAVKLLHEALATDSMFLRRFESEARLVGGLNHPHIMAVHDWGQDQVPYLVTEYLSGGSLRSMLDNGERLSPSQALVIGLEAARALDHAHRRGLVHRDIKPDNLLFDEDGRVRIADFGLARALAEASVTEPDGAFVGTARYASPEQAIGETLTTASDIYSLALVLGEAIEGNLPFDADTSLGTLMARTATDYEPGSAVGPLINALRAAGQIDPGDRPDADGFALALMATADALPRPEPLPLVGADNLDGHYGQSGDLTELGAGAVSANEPTPTKDEVTFLTDESQLTRKEQKVLARRAEIAERNERFSAIERGDIKRRRWPWAVVVLLLIGGAVAGGILLNDASQVTTNAMPNVVNQPANALDGQVEAFGWTVRIEESRQPETTAGTILSQDPSPGTQLENGAEVTIKVSLGEPLATVPTDLVGRQLQEVELLLQASDLTLGDIARQFDENAPVDQVLLVEDTLPQLNNGTAISVVVSDGPAPRNVPDGLVGADFETAKALLEAQRLVATQDETFDPNIPEGIVLSASHQPGTELAVGDTVELLVSLGREPIVVPDVEKLDLADAQELLEDAGFVVIEVESPPGNPVLTTDPPAGAERFRGDEVTIFMEGIAEAGEGV